MVLHILKCDSLMPDVVEAQGDYGEIYTARLKAAGFKGDTIIYDVVNQKYPSQIGADDQIMLSGSKLNSYDNDPWILELNAFVKAHLDKVPILAVCFGHQTVARAMGAKVGPTELWEASGYPVQSSPLAQTLFPTLGESPKFMHMHRDQVFEVPSGCERLFSSSVTPVQGFYKKNVLSVQFHPEFDEQIVSIICNKRFAGEQLSDCLERAKIENDGPEFFRYAVKFLNKEL